MVYVILDKDTIPGTTLFLRYKNKILIPSFPFALAIFVIVFPLRLSTKRL